LRAELSRLATEETKDTSPKTAPAPKVRVAGVDDEKMMSDSLRIAAIVGGVLLFFLVFGGGGYWLYVRTRSKLPADGIARVPPEVDGVPADTAIEGNTQEGDDQTPGTLPAEVMAMVRKAKDSDTACKERDALANWTAAREALQPYAEIAADELTEAGKRVEALTAAIEARNNRLDNLEALVERAKELFAERNVLQAKRQAAKAQADLQAMKCPGQRGADLLDEIKRLLGQSPVEDTGTVTASTGSQLEPPPAPDPADVLLDKPRDGILRWRSETWANSIEMKIEGDAAKNEQYVSLLQQKGNAGKWVVSLRRFQDVSEYDFLRLDMRVRKSVSVALGVWVGSELFETKPVRVREKNEGKGWTALSFSLKGRGFKCASTGWQHQAEISDPAAVNKISLFIYTASGSPIHFCNVRLRGKKT
jgi:hypothetical protein